MNCPRCRAENSAGRRFCSECGSPLALSCASCGFANEAGAKFCGGCGQALGAAAPSAASRTPAAAPSATPPPTPQSYTPRHLAERILTTRSAVEGERKEVTVLFADLKGSMELLAGRDPEDARKILDAVLLRMMDAVHRYEGTVNQVLGDGIMALFGAPLALEEHAMRACSAALSMQESIARYAAESGESAVKIRVGLNSGEVVVRAIGSDLKMDYTAIGQTTHLAARMEQTAAPGTILLTEETRRLAEGYIQVRPLGPTVVKGMSAPIPIFELAGTAPTRTRLQVSAARGLTPFVGRTAEREMLPRALARAAERHGQIVAIVGEPGVGKSRLFWEFTHSPQTAGWLTLESRSTSHGKATPYFPIIDLLRVYFGIEERDDTTALRDRVHRRLLELGDAMATALVPLLSLLGAVVDDAEWDAMEPAARRRRVMDAVRRLLLAETQRQGVLLIFEDLQWIDSETQALLDGLVNSLATARLLLLVNYRPGYQHTWGSKTYYTQLRVDPLAPENAEELLLALLGDAAELAPLKRQLIERTQGNPFFIEESVRALVETGVLAGARGAYRLAHAIDTIQIPPTVQAILAARIDRLSAAEKQILQCSSVIGKDVAFVLLHTIADLPEDELLSGLSHLQTAEFMYETSLFPALEYTFKHALTHEVAYRSLLNERRRSLHGRIVAAMETLDANRVTPDHVERLAHHAFRGELWDKAVTYLRRAGAKAQRASAHREAVGWLQQALEALSHLPESQVTLEHGVDLRLDLRASLYPAGELEKMLTYLQEAAALAERLGDARRVGWVSIHTGEYYRQTGRFAEACDLIERAQVLAEKLQDMPLRLASHHYLALARYALGDYRHAGDLLLVVGGAWSRQTDYAPGTFGGAVTGLGAGSLAINLAWRARCLAECGEFAEGIACAKEGLAIAEELASPYTVTATASALGYLYVLKGDFDEAIPLLERALATARESHIALYEAHALRGLGIAYVRCGRVGEGLELLQQARTFVESRALIAHQAIVLGWLGEAYLAGGRVDEAAEAGARALALARERGQRGDAALALRLLGDVAAARAASHADAAAAAYREALALAGELEMRPLVGACHLALGRLLVRHGEHDRAAEQLVLATTLFCRLGMRGPVEQAVTAMNALGRLFIVGRDHGALYECLNKIVASGQRARVILDRRDRHDTVDGTGDRRTTQPADRVVTSSGLTIVREP
jgi:class 3 adenylate cyclase/tetratricopeptide (TPR) repeat protein